MTRLVGNFIWAVADEFSCSNLRCRFMLQSAEWPLLRTIFSSSCDSWEISGITWVDSDKLFLLLRMKEPRFDRLISLGAAAIDTLLSISLIEYFIWNLFDLIKYWWNVLHANYLIAWSDDLFIVIIVIKLEIKVIEKIIGKIHIGDSFLRNARQFWLLEPIDCV